MYGAALAVFLLAVFLFFNNYETAAPRVTFREYRFRDSSGYNGIYRGGSLPKQNRCDARGCEFVSKEPMPAAFGQKRLALVMSAAFYPVEISLNGRPLYFQGSVRDRAQSYVLNSVLIPVDPSYYTETNTFELTVRVYRGKESHPLPQFYIAQYTVAAGDVFRRNFVITSIVNGGYLTALILSIYFLAMYPGYKKNLYLYTALSAFFFAFSMVVIVYNYPSNAMLLLEKISRVSFPLCLLFVFLFFYDLTAVKWSKKIIVANALYLLPFALRTLTASDRFDVSMRFNETMVFYIMPNLFAMLVMIFSAVIRGRFGANRLIYLSFFATLAASVHDMIYVLNDRTPYAYITSVGYLLMVVSIFINLSREQSLMY